MRIDLKDYQQGAVDQVLSHVRGARDSVGATQHAFVLSAPTGSGKTAVITAVMERLLRGDDLAEADASATFLWVTDAPELNEQSKKKILASSEVLLPRRLDTIDVAFDQPVFDPGKVYFLNTQKLGQATSYTRTDDSRTHTLWETISRTVLERARSFYLIVDEAHKGLGRRTKKQLGEEATILSRLIVGGNGYVPPPLLIGISATPKRFNDLLENATGRVRWPTLITPEAVRDSGLLKDEIILWHTPRNGRSDWAMLRQAARRLRKFEQVWDVFCEREGREHVKPILVVQVADAVGKSPTRTDLAHCLDEIQQELGPLPSEALGHCFQEPGALPAGPDRTLRKVFPSDIQDDADIRVVFFKMALNTGWDCPRAEVMMSFRRAVDQTHIAQLVGRMVRTPLAERILTEPFLNSVALYLPNWDSGAVDNVIKYLTTSEDALPTEVERGEELVTYERAPRSGPLFRAAAQLPTYPAKRASKASNVKRLLQLARYLANDDIAKGALSDAQGFVMRVLASSRRRLAGRMTKLVTAIQSVDLIETRLLLGFEERSSPEVGSERPGRAYSLRLVERNVQDLFADSGRRLGSGLHLEYVSRRTAGPGRTSQTLARAELCVLMNDEGTQARLEQKTGNEVRRLWEKYHAERLSLSPERRAQYAQVNRVAAAPMAEDLVLPEEITVRRGPKAFPGHIYCDQSNDYMPSPALNGWERLTLEAAMREKGFRGWFRNPVRKEWSLGVSYDERGLAGVMYPDLLIFRSVRRSGIAVDVLEPHAASQGDLTPKLLGLCRYAEQHGDKFRRIAAVLVEGAKGRERLLYIDVNDEAVRARARLLTENPQVIALARELN
jgi:type III restriction enzyme